MDINDYQRFADSLHPDYQASSDRLTELVKQKNGMRLLHGLLGMIDEVGEIAKAIKARIYYGKTLDIDNLVEETGDLAWFLAEFSSGLGKELSEILEANQAKLRRRYPDGFSERSAIARRDKAQLRKPMLSDSGIQWYAPDDDEPYPDIHGLREFWYKVFNNGKFIWERRIWVQNRQQAKELIESWNQRSKSAGADWAYELI